MNLHYKKKSGNKNFSALRWPIYFYGDTRSVVIEPPDGKRRTKPRRINTQNTTGERIASYRMQTRDRPRCRRKVKQIATNGINGGIRDTLHRTVDFPTGQKCHLGGRSERYGNLRQEVGFSGMQNASARILS